jgi:hypothetical protein
MDSNIARGAPLAFSVVALPAEVFAQRQPFAQARASGEATQRMAFSTRRR